MEGVHRLRLAALCMLCISVSQCRATQGAISADPEEAVPSSPKGALHGEGICAMYGICGAREDGKALNCPNNVPAYAPTAGFSRQVVGLCPSLNGYLCCSQQQFQVLKDQVKQAIPFIVGCPACLRNFLDFFCALACSPDQSLVVNVTGLTKAYSTNKTSVSSIDFYASEALGTRFYNSCADVKFGAMNTRAMDFIGGGATDYADFFDFLGNRADQYEPGSPYAISFPLQPPPGSPMKPLNLPMAPCSDPALGCSCGDCPTAIGCSPPAPAPPGNTTSSCRVQLLGWEGRCLDFGLAAAYVVYLLLILIVWVMPQRGGTRGSEAVRTLEADTCTPLIGGGQEELESSDGAAETGEIVACQEGGSVRDRQIATRGAAGEGEKAGEEEEEEVELPEAGFMHTWFRWQGTWVAQHPFLILSITGVLAVACMAGLAAFQVETRPEKLWVRPDSIEARHKAFYDQHLGPFYRIEQLIFATAPDASGSSPSIVTDANIDFLFEVEAKVEALQANVSGVLVSLTDICLKPIGDECATQSILQYWKMDPDKLEDLGGVDHAEFCFQHYSSSEPCLSAFKAPMDPNVVLGGFPEADYSKATAFVITYPVNNLPQLDNGTDSNPMATAWEEAFIQLAQSELTQLAAKQGLTLAYSAEGSVEAELKRESRADVLTIMVSYLVMFVYISFTLGEYAPRLAPVYVTSKVLLGLSGVAIVIVSVLTAIGLCSAFGVRSTLIIVEVIPFLVLAVGVDNMCILVHSLKRQDRHKPIEARVAAAMAEAGPSITLASLSEVVAFAVAVWTPMPACQVFSLFAALAVLIDYLLQVTAFAALMTLDLQRTEGGRVDCLPCFVALPEDDDSCEDDQDGLAAEARHTGDHPTSWLQQYMTHIHAPCLSVPAVKAAVMAVFGAMLCVSISLGSRLTPGLDQSIALPRDSYLQGYFRNITEYLRVGPPLFFVVRDYNYSLASDDTDNICAISGCSPHSLVNEVSRAALSPTTSFIARPAASWLDDFLSWLSPNAFGCCREWANHTYCPPDDQPPCCPEGAWDCSTYTTCASCTTCVTPSELINDRPTSAQFRAKLPWFLDAVPSADCAKGGHGAYSGSVDLTGFESGTISSSEFRTYHTPLHSQADFVGSLRAVRQFVEKLRGSLGIDVFAYSVFYIFFEQYLDIFQTAVWSVGLATAAVFLVCWLVTSSLWMSAIVLLILELIVINMLGLMQLWSIQLNAVSVVNLVMTIGIGVEFCVHITHSFAASHGSRQARAHHALATMGSSVFSGITLTKFVGVVVLSFSQSELFEVYYFRMYFGLVIIGAFHGLVFLPVLLSLCGPAPIAHVRRLAPDGEERKRVVLVRGN